MGQGRPVCQKSWSKVKQFKVRASADGQTDGRYQMHYLPCFVVDKNQGHRSTNLAVRVFTDTHTDRWKDGCYSMTSTAYTGGNYSYFGIPL